MLKALDIIRIVGNNAVHPGELDVNDSPEIVSRLFILINKITDYLITSPKQMDELLVELPAKSLEAIAQRDSK